MTRLARRAALVVATTLTAGALAACSSGSDGSMSGMDHDETSMSTSETSTAADGRQGDVMFAQMMIPHHEQAITMADLALDLPPRHQGRSMTSPRTSRTPKTRRSRRWEVGSRTGMPPPQALPAWTRVRDDDAG